MTPEPTNEQDIELIERYLDGELTPEETGRFEKRLSEDDRFAEMLKFRQELPEVWKLARRQFLIRQELERKLAPGKSVPFRISYRLAAAASLLILVGMIFTHISKDSDQQNFSSGRSVKVNAPEQAPAAGDSALIFGESGMTGPVLTPGMKGICTIPEPVGFRWRPDPKQEESSITILESGSRRLVYFQKLPPGQNFFTLHPNVLKPGSYEWFAAPDATPGTFTIQP